MFAVKSYIYVHSNCYKKLYLWSQQLLRYLHLPYTALLYSGYIFLTSTNGFSHDFKCKLRASVGDYLLGKTCASPDMVHIQLGSLFGCNGFRQGAKIMALLKRSTTTNMESEFRDSERSVTKSMVMDFHTPVGIWFGCRGILVFGLFLVDWHTTQPSTKFFVYWESPCYAPCLSSVHVLLTCYLFHQITAYVYYRPAFPPYWTSLGLSCYLDT